MPLISVVIPARNAGTIIDKCLSSLRELDYPKDKIEIIIVDGASTDDTRAIAKSHGAKVISNPMIRVVTGRNIGFEASKGELVAFSDTDCVMAPDWLRNCLKYFEDDRVAGVGGPNLIPESEKGFAKAVGLIFDYAYVFNAGAPTKKYDRVLESRFHGSNAIYRASVLHQVMPVDEGMYEGEDVVMNGKIKQLGYKLLYVPDVIVWHHRRTTPKKWWSQMFVYGLGKVLMRRRIAGMVTFPQMLLGFTLPILFLSIVILVAIDPLFTLVSLLGAVVLGSIVSMGFAFLATRSFGVAVNMPLAIGILPIAWSCGFWREFLFPRRTRAVEEQ